MDIYEGSLKSFFFVSTAPVMLPSIHTLSVDEGWDGLPEPPRVSSRRSHHIFLTFRDKTRQKCAALM